MSKYGCFTRIGVFKVNNMSGGASINFGNAVHKGLQANVKLNAGEVIAGDEISICCPPEEENNNENENDDEENENNNENIEKEDVFINKQWICKL